MQLQSLILAAAAVPCALAASWGYGDALVTISPKGLGKGVREMYVWHHARRAKLTMQDSGQDATGQAAVLFTG